MKPDTARTARGRFRSDPGSLTRTRHDFSVQFAIPCDRHHEAWLSPLARQAAASSCASSRLRRRRCDVIGDDSDIDCIGAPAGHYAGWRMRFHRGVIGGLRSSRSLSEISSVGWLGLVWHARRCRNVRIALLFGASLHLDPAIRSTSPSSVIYLRQAPRLISDFR